jgi:hypothetical protein
MPTTPPTNTDGGGAILDLSDAENDADLQETDDGGAIAQMEEDDEIPTADQGGFYDNIVDSVDEGTLDTLVQELWRKIDYDRESRKDRDKQYEEGLRRTGLGNDAPGGMAFQGASKVVHPMITKAAIDYSSRSVKELLPAGGPVKIFIPGKNTQARLDKAERKRNYMNWQCTQQMPELKYEIEQGMTQESIAGAFYLRLVYDGDRKRPVPVVANMDEIILPYAATSFYTAERVTWCEYVTETEYKSRVREGIYKDIDLLPPSLVPDRSDAEKANDKIEGRTTDPYNQDGLRLIYHIKVNLDLEDDKGAKPLPYLIQIDYTQKVALTLTRNWEEEDKTQQAMDWIVEFPFVPWRGAYPVGLVHLIGGLAAASTGTLRALLDSGHINNLPTLLKLKGTNFMGQSIELQATGVHEIEGAVATDDIRKLVMSVPFNQPSMVLFQLLGFLVGEAADVVKVTMDSLADQSVSNMPVGTTLALIEQGLKVLSAIHARQHAAFARFLGILHRINRMYLTDDSTLDETGELMCYRSDFQGPIDCVPVSDPEIFSDVQRYAQIQLLEQRAQQMPQLYDLRKVELLILARTKIPDAIDLLLPSPQTEEMNAVNENVALVMGRPVMAYPDQDHLSHIQVLLDFMQSPVLGSLSIIATAFIPGALNHLKEHIVLWYVGFMEKAATASVGKPITDLMQYKDPETRAELDKLLATISGQQQIGAAAQAQNVLSGIPPIIQKAQALLQQLRPPGASVQNTPQVAAAQIKAQTDQQKLQQEAQAAQQDSADKAQERQMQLQLATSQEQAEDQRAQRDLMAEAAGVQAEQQNKIHEVDLGQQHADLREAATNESKERINAADNATAESISAADIAAGKHSNLTTGTGIGKRESDSE